MEASSPQEGQKPSRYRSVRQHQTDSPVPQTQESETVQRSRSRYHRRPKTAQGDESSSPAPQLSSPEFERKDSTQGVSWDQTGSRDGSRDPRRSERHGQGDAAPGAQDSRLHESSRAKDESLERSNKAEVRFDQAPQIIRARKERELGPQDEVISDHEGGGCFSGFFKKKRIDPIKNVSEKQKPLPLKVNTDKPDLSTTHTRTKEAPLIKPGGGGVVPGTDAPISASNSGDRRVLVDYKKSSMLLPVTPETTAMDLINSASNVFSDPLDVKATVLLEHFGNVGVQRPLRRYERVRDVMNSWDDDRANSLLLIPSVMVEANTAGLSASDVPSRKPQSAPFLMHYSQKPGHWDKRLITIRDDGQIVMSKDKDHEATNICHLSDFDIYSPTAKAMSKRIKPPKKFCYAIKSQQKTSMFLSHSTYVHFFCANDKTLATSFYDAVQGWRSWYLVHVMGEGSKPRRQDTTGVHRSPSKANRNANHAHHDTTSSTGSNYQLGSFQPLAMDMTQFDRPSSSHSQHHPTAMNHLPARKPSVRDRTHPPTSFPKKMLADDEPLANLANNHGQSLEGRNDNDTFNASGLLGRSYSTRRREQAEKEEVNDGPFTGSGLVSNITTTVEGGVGIARQTSIKRSGSRRNQATSLSHRPSTRDGPLRRHGSVDLGRSDSTRRPMTGHKPLVDLTPTYQPPPQHVKKGGAYRPSPAELTNGALIDAATSGEKSWRDEIPEAKDWRGRAGHAGGEMNQGRARSRSRSATVTQNSSHSGHSSGRGRYASPTGADEGFTGNGYLGQAPPSSSRGNKNFPGQGQGPLLDVSDGATFTKGSLLHRVDREQSR